DALALIAEVFDDAEQVAGVDAGRQGSGAALAGEDGEAVDDDVERVARDREAEMFFGVEQCEALEGFVEESADAGVLARARGPASQLLLLAPLLERGAGGVDLLGGDGLVVELDAGAPTAIGARPVVERARPGLGDEPQDLGGKLARS